MKNFALSKPSRTTFVMFFISAFLVRAGVFYWYTQEQERYCQPDSMGYHVCAVDIVSDRGMTDMAGRPHFWRTPGYPAFLALFYTLSDSHDYHLQPHQESIKWALWVQIILCSLLPILYYFLAYFLTHSLALSYLLALIGTFHPGSVLASTFLLTDGPAQIFFTFFLICFFRNFRFPQTTRNPVVYLTGAAVALGIYTWMRPMGQFVALGAIVIMFLARYSWKENLRRGLYFFAVFSISVAPWFVRNYQLTGKVFFCPLFGLYLNVFNAPKIKARIENIPLEQAHKELTVQAGRYTYEEYVAYARCKSPYSVCQEMVCLRSAWPWISGYPGYFLYDWTVEVLKTTFDLYSYQLVSLYNNHFKWDPLVEYLPTKLAETLWSKPLPWYMRLIAYIELLSQIVLWIGILAGLFRREYTDLWLASCMMMGAVVAQTGGFGYARLRLPIEPLICILGSMFWYWLITRTQHEISLRALARKLHKK